MATAQVRRFAHDPTGRITRIDYDTPSGWLGWVSVEAVGNCDPADKWVSTYYDGPMITLVGEWLAPNELERVLPLLAARIAPAA